MSRSIVKWIGAGLNILSYAAPEQAGKLAFRLFCRPVRTSLKPFQRNFLNSADKFSLTFNGQALQGYRWGSGRLKILLLHGWQSHSACWINFVQAFPPEDYSVYAIDAPGHGLSGGSFFHAVMYAEVIRHLYETMGRFHYLAGHSIGGFAILYALKHFDELQPEKTAVMSVPGRIRDYMSYFNNRLNLNKRVMNNLDNYFCSYFGMMPDDFSVKHMVPGADKSGLIVHDENDPYAPVKYAYDLNAEWNSSRLVITSGSGHQVPSTRVAEQVKEFFSHTETVFTARDTGVERHFYENSPAF
jgi:pimeloyl-ACP methyl ester carboxylesterase